MRGAKAAEAERYLRDGRGGATGRRSRSSFNSSCSNSFRSPPAPVAMLQFFEREPRAGEYSRVGVAAPEEGFGREERFAGGAKQQKQQAGRPLLCLSANLPSAGRETRGASAPPAAGNTEQPKSGRPLRQGSAEKKRARAAGAAACCASVASIAAVGPARR